MASFKRASFNIFEDLQPKPKSKEGEEEYYLNLGIRKKRPTSKQRRGKIKSALRKKGLSRRVKSKDPMKQFGKVHIRGKKDRTKQDPPYFWGLPSILRRF